MSSPSAGTLNTVITQVEGIERMIGEFLISFKNELAKLTGHGEKTFESLEDRLEKASENLNAITVTANEKCEGLPSLITLIIFSCVAGTFLIVFLLFLFAKCIHRNIHRHYARVQRSKMQNKNGNKI